MIVMDEIEVAKLQKIQNKKEIGLKVVAYKKRSVFSCNTEGLL